MTDQERVYCNVGRLFVESSLTQAKTEAQADEIEALKAEIAKLNEEAGK